MVINNVMESVAEGIGVEFIGRKAMVLADDVIVWGEGEEDKQEFMGYRRHKICESV